MKKWNMFFGLMMASSIMFAQRKLDPMDRGARQAEKMKMELSLDDVQYKAVKAINEDFASEMMKLSADSTLSREDRHKKRQTLHQEKEVAMAKVLTTEQKNKWTSYRAKQSAERKTKMARHRSEHAERMQKNLSLSDEQTSRIKSIDREFGEKFRALRTDSTLAREDVREKVKQLREDYRVKTKSVLTEEQFRKWELRKADRKRRKF